MSRFTVWIGDLVTGGQVSALMAVVKRQDAIIVKREAQLAAVMRALEHVNVDPPL